MGADSGAGTSDRGSSDGPDDSRLEPEIIRWLRTYAEADEDRRDATVAAAFDAMSRLLSRYRRENAAYRDDYATRLRRLTEQMPVTLWTTDAELRVTTFAGGGLAAVDIDPESTISLPLIVVLGADSSSFGAGHAHQRALQGQPAVFEYDRRSRSYRAHVQPLSGPDGTIVGTIGLAIDVTEVKQAEEALARREAQMTESRFRSLINESLQADVGISVTPEARGELERRRQVRSEMRAIDADVRAATAASARNDWTATLEAVRMIQGRAMVTRQALEGLLGTHAGAADLPPLVRAVQVVGRLISVSAIDSLPPDELRDRMHAVLRVLDRELQAFLEPPEEESTQAGPDRDTHRGGESASGYP